MGGGLLTGLSNMDAARYAFLLATPIIGAAAVLKLPDLLGSTGDGVAGRRSSPSLCSALTAYLAVRFLMRFFETNRRRRSRSSASWKGSDASSISSS